MTVRIKICCIGSRAEAQLAIQAGASALGLVSAMPSGPGVIPENEIADIAAMIPLGVASVLLTSLQSSNEIIAQQRRLRANALQLVDELPVGAHEDLRTALPGIRLLQVIHVLDRSSIDRALACSSSVDGLLLDSGNPSLAVKELGGTGRTHDWALSREIVSACDCPVFLAGGLTADNVADAIERVRPFGVDVCSGVRSGGRLDPNKLDRFISAVHESP